MTKYIDHKIVVPVGRSVGFCHEIFASQVDDESQFSATFTDANAARYAS